MNAIALVLAHSNQLHTIFYSNCFLFVIYIISGLSIQSSCWNERFHHLNHNLIIWPAANSLAALLLHFLPSNPGKNESGRTFEMCSFASAPHVCSMYNTRTTAAATTLYLIGYLVDIYALSWSEISFLLIFNGEW